MRIRNQPGRPPTYTQEQREDVIRLALANPGISAKVIGEMAGGVGGGTVLRWLIEEEERRTNLDNA